MAKIKINVYLEPEDSEEVEDLATKHDRIKRSTYFANSLVVGARVMHLAYKQIPQFNEMAMIGLKAAFDMADKQGMSLFQLGEEEE